VITKCLQSVDLSVELKVFTVEKLLQVIY
jgi:hypothetical protein